jgi:hypothetical protein
LVADRASVKPLAGGRGRKRLRTTVKQPNPAPQADHVITQVELPPYRGPRNPLDLVIVEIIFGRIFEVFHQMSQDAAAGAAPAGGDKPLQKKAHWVLMKKTLALRYSDTLLFHFYSLY